MGIPRCEHSARVRGTFIRTLAKRTACTYFSHKLGHVTFFVIRFKIERPFMGVVFGIRLVEMSSGVSVHNRLENGPTVLERNLFVALRSRFGHIIIDFFFDRAQVEISVHFRSQRVHKGHKVREKVFVERKPNLTVSRVQMFCFSLPGKGQHCHCCGRPQTII